METSQQPTNEAASTANSSLWGDQSPEVVVIEDRSISEYFRILAKYRRLILACFLLFAVGAAALCLLLPNQFTSSALVAIEPYLVPLPGTSQQGMLVAYSNTEFYAKNRMNYLASYQLADRLLSRPGIGDELKKALSRSGDESKLEESQKLGYKNPLPLIERYMSRVENLRLPTTTTTKLWASLPGALLSAQAVNAHAEEFIRMVEEEEHRDSESRIQYLQNRSVEIQIRMEEAEKKINDYLVEHPLSMGIFSEFSDFARMSAFDLELRRLGELSAMAIDKVAQSKAEESNLTADRLRKSIDDGPTISGFRTRLADLETEKARLEQIYRPEHPKVVAMTAAIDSMRHEITNRTLTLVEKAQTEVESKVRVDSQQLEGVAGAIRSSQLRAADQIVEKFQLQARQREFLRIHDLFEVITKNLEEAKMTAEVRLTNITVISPAIPPVGPSSPNRPVILAIACFLGPLLGCLLAFILNMLDNSIYSVEDMATATGVASIGMIPSLGMLEGDENHNAVAEIVHGPSVTDGESAAESRDGPGANTTRGSTASPQGIPENPPARRSSSRSRMLTGKSSVERSPTGSSSGSGKGGTGRFKQTQRFTDLFRPMRNTTSHQRSATELLTVVEPFSDFTEAFRNIRTSVMLEAAGKEAKTLLVTSSIKGEGKSTVAGNLAVSMAQFGHKVLLVDADLRRPTLHQFFGMARDSAGLGDYLRGDKGSYEIVYRTSVPGLDFVSAGSPVPNPAELVGTKLMKGFLELMVESYDFIVIDAPPVLPVADARILSLIADGVLFTVRSGVTERQVARNGVRRLQQLGVRVTGTILNDVDVSDALFYHESSDDYGPDEEQMPWFAQIRNEVATEDDQIRE